MEQSIERIDFKLVLQSTESSSDSGGVGRPVFPTLDAKLPRDGFGGGDVVKTAGMLCSEQEACSIINK